MNVIARVRAVIEVDVSGGWDDKCDIRQVLSQTADSARGALGNMKWPPRIKLVSVGTAEITITDEVK